MPTKRKKKVADKPVVYLDKTGLLLYNNNGCQTALGFVIYDKTLWRDTYGVELNMLRQYSRSHRVPIDEHIADEHNALLESAQLAALDLCNIGQSVAPFKFCGGKVLTYLDDVVAAADDVSCVTVDDNAETRRYLFLRDGKTFAFFHDGTPETLVELKRIA